MGFWVGIIMCLIIIGVMVWIGCDLLANGNIKIGRFYIILAIISGLLLIIGSNLWKPDLNAHNCNCEYCTIEEIK